MPSEPLLTPQHVARLLGVTVQTLSAWRCLGRTDLPFVKVGRLVRYERDAVEAWVQRHTVPSNGAGETPR